MSDLDKNIIQAATDRQDNVGVAGRWVCAANTHDREKIAIYRMTNPPDREDIELVRITLSPVGQYIEDPTLDAEIGSHDFLQAAMDCAWRLGMRPRINETGQVTRAGTQRLIRRLQDEGYFLVKGIGANGWRNRLRKPEPQEGDAIDVIRRELQGFLDEAFTPDPPRALQENGR